jgi:hypothetical protein
VRFCPCGLTQEKVEKFNKIDEDLFCTAIRRGSTTREKCGELLADHPRDSDLPAQVPPREVDLNPPPPATGQPPMIFVDCRVLFHRPLNSC